MNSSVERISFCSARKPQVSVLTPTIPGREEFLAECRASVAGQTVQVHEHLWMLDEEGLGCAKIMNQLAGAAEADLLFILADDDLMLPRCLELHMRAGGDVVYAPPLVWGEDAAQFCARPPNIPATALVSKAFWEKFGGYDESATHTEDLFLWRLAESRGCTFTRIDEHPTWVYRFHGANKSRHH